MMYTPILGTARFGKEPTVHNIKNVNLEELSENLWMSDQNTIISGSNIYLRNMFIKAKVFIKVRIYKSKNIKILRSDQLHNCINHD